MKKKPDLVFLVLNSIATLLIAFFAVFEGIMVLVRSGSSSAGHALMYLLIGAMLILGYVYMTYSEFKEKKDVHLLGILLSYLSIMILTFIGSSYFSYAISAVPLGILLFVYLVFSILNLFSDHKVIKILCLVFASMSLVLSIAFGIEVLTSTSYSVYGVLIFFGYFFLGLSIFIKSIFLVVTKKAVPEPSLSPKQIEDLKALKADHEAGKIDDASYEEQRNKIVG